ncbi:MAG: hypothetical protein ACYTEQ_18470 [Planctomycetota bacterium]|jgi:hypothetical protein
MIRNFEMTIPIGDAHDLLEKAMRLADLLDPDARNRASLAKRPDEIAMPRLNNCVRTFYETVVTLRNKLSGPGQDPLNGSLMMLQTHLVSLCGIEYISSLRGSSDSGNSDANSWAKCLLGRVREPNKDFRRNYKSFRAALEEYTERYAECSIDTETAESHGDQNETSSQELQPSKPDETKAERVALSGNSIETATKPEPSTQQQDLGVLVTLTQIEPYATVGKRQLKRLITDGELPKPDVPAEKAGKPHQWKWGNMRAALEDNKLAKRPLPDKFPTDPSP